MLTVILVPAGYYLYYRNRETHIGAARLDEVAGAQ